MDLCEIGISSIFGSICRHAQQHRRWHYGMLLCNSNNNSLSKLLNLSNTDFIYLLQLLQLIRIHPNNSMIIIKKAFEFFLIAEGLNQQVFFDKQEVSNVPKNSNSSSVDSTLTNDNKFITYKGHWLGLGATNKFTKKVKSNPSSQFDYYEKPPRVQGDDEWKNSF